jgi:Ca2+-binding RTX toxin-like protein
VLEGNISFGGGNDVLNGKAGNDVLFGESGADSLVFERGTGGNVIGDFEVGTDRIDLRAFGFDSYSALATNFVEVAGTSAIILGNGDLIVINGVTNVQLTVENFLI